MERQRLLDMMGAIYDDPPPYKDLAGNHAWLKCHCDAALPLELSDDRSMFTCPGCGWSVTTTTLTQRAVAKMPDANAMLFGIATNLALEELHES